MTEPIDPFDQLAAVTDDSVDATFSARLRARVTSALGATPDRIIIDLPSRIPVSTAIRSATRIERTTTMNQVITPYICVHDAAAALDWYREYFGADVSNVIPWEGRVGHAELDVAGAVFYLSDEAPQLGVVAPARMGPSRRPAS